MGRPLRGQRGSVVTPITFTKPGKSPAFKAPLKDPRLGPLLVDGDHAAIRWRFEFMDKDGARRMMEEVAWQTWRGEEVIEEHFLYDPAALRRKITEPAAATG